MWLVSLWYCKSRVGWRLRIRLIPEKKMKEVFLTVETLFCCFQGTSSPALERWPPIRERERGCSGMKIVLFHPIPRLSYSYLSYWRAGNEVRNSYLISFLLLHFVFSSLCVISFLWSRCNMPPSTCYIADDILLLAQYSGTTSALAMKNVCISCSNYNVSGL